MRHLWIAIAIFLIGAPLACADQPGEVYADAKEPAATATLTVKGIVVSVGTPDPLRDLKAELRLTSESGESLFFLVADKATIKGKDGTEIPLGNLKAGDQVSLDYVIYRYTPRNRRVFEVQAISIL